MNELSKNSTVSLGVMFTGCFMTFVSPHVEPTKELQMIGLMLVPLGLVQFHFGFIPELKKAAERRWHYVLGVLVTIAAFYCISLDFRDYQGSWPQIVALVIATLILQLFISVVWTWIWNLSEKIKVKVD